MHLFTCSTSGHMTKMAVMPFDRPLPKILCGIHTSPLCVIDAKLLAMKFSNYKDLDLCWHGGFPLREYWMIVDLFCSCDLDLDPMTFTYELRPVLPGDKLDV